MRLFSLDSFSTENRLALFQAKKLQKKQLPYRRDILWETWHNTPDSVSALSVSCAVCPHSSWLSASAKAKPLSTSMKAVRYHQMWTRWLISPENWMWNQLTYWMFPFRSGMLLQNCPFSMPTAYTPIITMAAPGR